MLRLLSKLSFLFAVALCFVTPGFGQVWEWVNPKPQGDRINQIFFVNRLTGFFAPASANIYKTTDGGESWERIPTGVIFTNIYFIDENTGWGAGGKYFGHGKYGIYRTKDGGQSWEQVFPDTSYRCHDIEFVDSRNGWVIGDSNLWFTDDGGDTWTEQAIDQIFDYGIVNHDLSFRDAKRGWIGGFRSFILETYDGGETWNRDSTLFAYTKFSFVDSVNGWASGSEKLGTVPVQVMRTDDGGETWYEVSGTMTGTVYPISPDTCFAFADNWINRGIYKTADGGTSWEMLSDKRYKSAFFINQQEIWSSLNQSVDGGRNWESKTINIFSPGIDRLYAVDFVDAEIGWVAGRNVPAYEDFFIAKTTDGGKSWVKQVSGTSFEIFNLYFIDHEVGWAVGSDGQIRKTIDGGLTWIMQESGVSTKLKDLIFLDFLNGWIVGDGGMVLKTIDGGLTWEKISTGYPLHFDDVCFVDSSYGWISGNPYEETSIPS